MTSDSENQGTLTPRVHHELGTSSPGQERTEEAHLYQGEDKDFISTATWRRKFIITLSRQQEKKKTNKNVSRRLSIDFKILADTKMI